MNNKEKLENEIKKTKKKSKWFKIILTISIILGIASITSFNINIAVYIFGISIIGTIISIIFINKCNNKIESIKNDIHNIEVIRMGNEDSKN